MVTHDRMLSTAAHALVCMRDTSVTRLHVYQDGDTWTAYIDVGQFAEYLLMRDGPRGYYVTHATGVSEIQLLFSTRGITW